MQNIALYIRTWCEVRIFAWHRVRVQRKRRILSESNPTLRILATS